MSEFTPHPSHVMGEWESSIVTLVSTSRFGQIRQCLHCEAEHAKTVAGEAHHPELDLPCAQPHDWKYVEDWYGDPKVVVGYLGWQCQLCGAVDSERAQPEQPEDM